VNAFVAGGAEVDVINEKGHTPLHVAVLTHSDIEVIKALVLAKVALNIRNKAGATANGKACALRLNSNLLSLLGPKAAAAATAQQVDVTLLTGPSSKRCINITTATTLNSTSASAASPLAAAAAAPKTTTRKQSTMESLGDSFAAAAGAYIAKSSKLNATNVKTKAATSDDIRQQVLDAVDANDAKQLQLLLDGRASAAIRDDDGDTLLHIACAHAAAADCVQLILASGAD
jgi:ankyrin repeat protein